MIELLKLDGTKLSSYVGLLPPSNYDSNIIKNETLDGNMHIQVIGAQRKKFQVQIIALKNEADMITLTQAKAEKVKIVEDTKYYIGIIDSQPSWKVESRRYYSTRVNFNVTEEGTI